MLQMLQDRFREFARETESIGTERVTAANDNCDALIMADHSDSAQIAEWKDNLNEAWNDLLELMDTRTQMLQSSWELHKFYHDCKDILERILVCYLWMMKLMAVWLYLKIFDNLFTITLFVGKEELYSWWTGQRCTECCCSSKKTQQLWKRPCHSWSSSRHW